MSLVLKKQSLKHACVLLCGGLAALNANAADRTWNTSGPTNNWNTTDLNWDGGTPWAANDNAIFSGTGETVTLSTANSAGNLTFNATGYTIAGVAANPLTLAGTPVVTVTNGGDTATIGAVLAGSAGFTKAGAGTLTLGGANTFTGGVTVNAGVLNVTSNAALGTANSLALAGGTTLNFATAGGSYSVGAVSGSGTIGVTLGTGGATTTVGNGSTNWGGYTGVITIGTGAGAGAGKTSIQGSLSNAATTVNLATHATLYVSTAVTNNASITLGGGDTGESLGQLRLEGGAIWAGAVTLAGAITGTNDAYLGAFSGIGTISGAIGETGGAKILSKTGGGTVVLTGTNTYSGGTVIAAGTLQVGAGGATGDLGAAASASVASGATLAVNRTGTLALSGTVSNAGTVSNLGAGTLAISGVLSGAGTLVQSGTGTTVLSGTNTATGATTVSAGGLTLDYATNDNSKLADAGVLTLGNATLTLAGATGSHTEVVGSTTVTGGVSIVRSGANTAKIALGALTNNGLLDVAGAGLATTTTANNASGVLTGVTFSGGTAFAANDGSGNIVASGVALATVTRLESGAKTIANNAGAGVSIIDGAGSVAAAVTTGAVGTTDTFGIIHAATGATTVDIGAGNTLRLAAAGQVLSTVASGALTVTGGTLTAGGASDTAGTLVFANNVATTVASVLADNGTGVVALVKNGAGTLTLSGTNTYTGGTLVNAGALVLSSGAALGTGSVTVSSGGALTASSTVAATGAVVLQGGTLNGTGSLASSNFDVRSGSVAVVLSGTGAMTKSTSGTVTLSSISTYTGGTTVDAGTLVLAAGGGSGALRGNLTVNAGATVSSTTNDTLGYNSGAQVTTLTLNGGTYNNATGSNQGYLTNVVMTGGTLSATGGGQFYFNTGYTLSSNASAVRSTFSAPITLAGSGNFTVTTAQGTTSDGVDLAISGIVTGSRALAKEGAGTLLLTRVNTYTGGTIVNAGTLALGTGGAAGAVRGALTVNAGATVHSVSGDSLGYTADATRVSTLTLNGGTFDNATGANQGYSTNVVMTGGTLSSTGGGRFNFNTGFGLSTNAASTTAVVSSGIDIRAGSNLSVNVASGTVPGGTDLRISGVIGQFTDAPNASLTKTGAGTLLLTGTNTLAGSVTLSAGRLVTGNVSALGNASVAVNAGTLVIGDGATNTVTLGSGKSLVIADNAVLSLGVLNLASLNAAVGANGVVKLSGGGLYNFSTSGKLDLNGVFDGLVAGSYTYNLITGSGTPTNELNIANISGYNASVLSGLSFNNGVLAFTAVPEPSTYGLAGAATLAALAFVRRRKTGSRRE